MTINVRAARKPVSNKDIDDYISRAPDAAAGAGAKVQPEPKGVIRGNRRIITTGFAPEMVDRIDRASEKLGISRAAWINMALSRALDESGN